jgi:hypothetical protein
MSIHDYPLEHYPSLIATLVRYKAIKCVKREMAAKGVKLHQLTACQLQLLAEAYFESHRAELIRVATDIVRTAASLQSLAEKDARRRAKARAALFRRQITQKPPLRTLQKSHNQEAICRAADD